MGTKTFVATAEDSIIAKLEWSQHGGSERQLDDVAGIVAVRGETLDLAYVERWSPSSSWPTSERAPGRAHGS